MAQTPVEIEVETTRGHAVFVVPLLDGVKGTKLLMRLTKLLGPAMQKDSGAAALLSALDPDEFERTTNEVLSRAIARFPESGEVESNIKGKLGELFEGRVLDLLTLVWGALQANYPFVRNLAESLAARVPSLLTGQST